MTSDASGRYVLRWTEPTGAPAERELVPGQLTIGRSPPCDLVLADQMVSGEHARIVLDGDSLVLHDLQSRNGTFLNGERVASADLRPGDEITLGRSSLQLLVSGLDETLISEGAIQSTVILAPDEPPAAQIETGTIETAGVVSEELLKQPVISEEELVAAGIEVKVAEYAVLGGGLGSFVLVDFLRNSGVSADDIVVAGNEERPHSRYERLCSNSQIPPHERLRSHSESCPDNVWGFPGYAVREAGRELARGNLKGATAIMWSIFGEPAIAQTYTPRSADVFRAIDKEAERIGWRQMLRLGSIRAVRKSKEGRLLAVVSESDEHRRKHLVVSGRLMHLAIGYPAIQLLPDLGAYREKHRDRSRVVNAYEQHDHVYDHLRQNGGTVLLRGRGVVASRIIQRLWEERQRNKDIAIVHLHRSGLTEGHRYGRSRRAIEAQFEFQPFNWPKGCWGGEQRATLERATDDERKHLLEAWEGTTTASRGDWRRIIRDGTREGWYRPRFGVVKDVRPGENGGVVSLIESRVSGDGALELVTDFVIDCTGAVSSPDRSTLMADLIETYDLPRNKKGGLQVSNGFEVEGLRHEDARLYASGVTTLGGPHAAVDSFLGLQYAALRAVDSIYGLKPRPKGIRRLNGLYSFWQWTKWARGAAP